MQADLRECYRLLDVEPSVSIEKVKSAYREMVKVWHPDRFAHDPKLQGKAQEKLKQINRAYERICFAQQSGKPADSTAPSDSKTTMTSDAPPHCPRTAAVPPLGNIGGRKFIQLGIAASVTLVFVFLLTRKTESQRRVETQTRNETPVLLQQPSQSSPASVKLPIVASDTLKSAEEVRAAIGAQMAMPEIVGQTYFTVGSSRAEVLSVQGEPLYSSDQLFG